MEAACCNRGFTHSAGVEWNSHDAEIRGMGIPIHEEEYNAKF